jgi:hypothetical protein
MIIVRSQDKCRLAEVTELEVIEGSPGGGFPVRGNGRQLGTYPTKERSLEVLDEVQALLSPVFFVGDVTDSATASITDAYAGHPLGIADPLSLWPSNPMPPIYEMPEK